MTASRLINQQWWTHHERWLRLSSHASAAFTAARNPATPPSLVPGLMARGERFRGMAEEEREKAKKWEDG